MKKTNKTFKRFAAITSASLLAACAMAPVAFNAFAEGEDAGTTPTTIDYVMKYPALPVGSTISTVKAYKIFNGEFKDANTFNVLSWADTDAATGTLAKILEKLPAGDIKTALSNTSTAEDPAKAAAELIASYDGTDNLEIFAKAAAEALISDGIAATSINGLDTATDNTDDTVTFNIADLTTGYYVVVAETADTDDNNETTNYTSKSLGMLTVAGRASNNQIGNGDAKIALPEVEKKVKEHEKTVDGVPNNEKVSENNKWNDVADYDIGDEVDFKLYGTMPSNLEQYDKYYYKFTDTLVDKFDRPTSLTIKIDKIGADGVDSTDDDGDLTYTATFDKNANEWNVKNGETDVEDITIVYDGESNGFTVAFADIKGNQNADVGTIVTIEYGAVLNATAEIGNDGQMNTVDLTYSNNPNNSGGGVNSPTGTTPKDEVIVYTYEIDVLKEFKKADGTTATTPTGENFDKITFSLKPINGDALSFVLKNGVYYPASAYPNDQSTTELKLTSENKILLRGLDDGDYVLTEEVQPDGFNKANPITIEVNATTVNDQEWSGNPTDALTAFAGGTTDDGIVNATVTNTQGTTLPGTGGIGTTIFYLGGGAMAAIGGVYLISKRRMKKSEE